LLGTRDGLAIYTFPAKKGSFLSAGEESANDWRFVSLTMVDMGPFGGAVVERSKN